MSVLAVTFIAWNYFILFPNCIPLDFVSGEEHFRIFGNNK